MDALADADAAVGTTGSFLNQSAFHVGQVIEVEVATANAAEKVAFHHRRCLAKTIFVIFKTEAGRICGGVVLRVHRVPP